MKMLKLAVLPMAMMATSAFAAEQVVAVDTAPVAVTTSSYNTAVPVDANTSIVQNTTTQVVDGTRTIISTITHPAAVSAEAGSLGYGANIGWALNDKTELQVGYDGGDVGKILGNVKVKDVKYGIKTHFQNPYIAVQMRPASNWFTIGAGTLFPDDRLDVDSKSGGRLTVAGNTYQLNDSDKLVGTIKYKNHIAPFGTIGFHPNLNNHWGLFGDIGAAYMGKTDINVRAVNPTYVVNTTTNTVTTASQVAAQAEKELKDKDLPKWLPIVKIGATYRF